MRVVVLHESPGADPVAGEFRDAAGSYNRGLDFRLRFLDVGFTLRSLAVKEEDSEIPLFVAEVLRTFHPGVVLVLGRGTRLLECAAIAAKQNAPLAVLARDPGDRTASALSRLASILVLPEAGDEFSAGPDTRILRILPGEPAGGSLVDILVRSVKDGRNT